MIGCRPDFVNPSFVDKMSDSKPSHRERSQPHRRHSERSRSAPAKRGGTIPAATNWLYGRHAVTAALANPHRRWRRLAVLAGHEKEAAALVSGARAAQYGKEEAIHVLDHGGFAAVVPGGAVHQGLALEVEPLAQPGIEDFLRHIEMAAGRSIIVVLDRVSDPQNVGAVLRSAAAFGATAVVIPVQGGPPVTGALAKAASGALETVPLLRAVNLARALDRLKEAGFWICGLDETATQALPELELGERIALVLGSEGAGMRRLVHERCDYVARLPTRTAQPTLNVSNAAAVALYELVRSACPP